MAPVTQSLARVPEDDVRAMAAYLAGIAGGAQRSTDQASAFARERAFALTNFAAGDSGRSAGETMFIGVCATCHSEGGTTPSSRPVSLAFSTAVTAPDARNLIHMILEGVRPLPGERGFVMPGFANALTDQQVATIANYVRTRFSNRPAWDNIDNDVRNVRAGK
jgi:mono/diheme cytochrome c family protein